MILGMSVSSNCFQRPETTAAFLQEICQGQIQALHWLASGSHTRVFAFVWQQQHWVLRVARSAEQILKCPRAYTWLGHLLPVPVSLHAGEKDGFYWSIQARMPGRALSELPPAQQRQFVPQILSHWRQFTAHAPLLWPQRGYGVLDWHSGRGTSSSWQAFLADSQILRAEASLWQSQPTLWERFQQGREAYLQRCAVCPETAFVLHGDAKGANLLVHQDGLSGVVDWATLGCGDWPYDPAALLLYLPLALWDETEALIRQYYTGFEQQDLQVRLHCYMLHSALEALIQFAQRGPDYAAAEADMLQRLSVLMQRLR